LQIDRYPSTGSSSGDETPSLDEEESLLGVWDLFNESDGGAVGGMIFSN
jgi:hypothetical protein